MANYPEEYAAARETLTLSKKVADNYLQMLGAIAPRNLILPGHLGNRTGFQKTVLSDVYWFAKLYELITYFEIRDREKFTHAGFVMHFIPVFYGLYHSAIKQFEAGKWADAPPLWGVHFQVALRNRRAGSMEGITASIKTGVSAHVQGDMATALANAYRTWKANPKPAFAELKDDFFAKNRPTFDAAKAAFFLELQDKGPSPFRPEVGQLIIGQGEAVISGGLNIDEVYRWRETAWSAAATALKGAP